MSCLAKSEVRSRKPEVGSQKVGSRQSDRFGGSAVRRSKSEVRSRKSEVGSQKVESRQSDRFGGSAWDLLTCANVSET